MDILEQYIQDNPNLFNTKQFIERQDKINKIKGTFGTKGDIGSNGCGMIATHNILVLFNQAHPFQELARNFYENRKKSVWFNGLLGTRLSYIKKFLLQENIKLTRINYNKKSLEQGKNYLCLYFWYNPTIFTIGAHYQVIEYKDNIIVHNYYETYKDINEYYNKGDKKFLLLVYKCKKV